VFLYFRFYSESFELYRQNSKELFLLFIAPVPVFAILWAYQQWKWFKTLKAEKAKAELSMLQAQMDPHFFFNTLNNLYALTIKKSEKAPEVILKLSEMMRYTIYEGKKESVLVKDEIDYLLNYIELHKIRYKKKVDIQFTHNVEDNNAKIAPLLFIILLENAFKHGVESQSQDAFIHINLEQNENALSFEIKNNFDESEISKRQGIGLENLIRRLTLLFKQSFTFEVSKKGNIYTAILKVPLYV
jgi:LytS/YehU family sensor histidine kinase